MSKYHLFNLFQTKKNNTGRRARVVAIESSYNSRCRLLRLVIATVVTQRPFIWVYNPYQKLCSIYVIKSNGMPANMNQIAVNHCFRRNEYQHFVQTTVAQWWQNELFCDVTLACDNGQTLKAHRIILCSFSNYFNRLLQQSNEMGQDIVLILPDCRFVDVKTVMEFMYTGVVEIEQVKSNGFVGST